MPIFDTPTARQMRADIVERLAKQPGYGVNFADAYARSRLYDALYGEYESATVARRADNPSAPLPVPKPAAHVATALQWIYPAPIGESYQADATAWLAEIAALQSGAAMLAE